MKNVSEGTFYNCCELAVIFVDYEVLEIKMRKGL
jgi:hypothetical protein